MPPRHIFLFQTVNPMSSEMVIRQLLTLDRQSNEDITIFINSPGGVVSDFFAIFNTIGIIKSAVNTVVMGQASSAAAILAAVGNKRMITEDSEFMLHEVWAFLMGSVSEVDEKGKRMKKLQDRLLSILSKKTGKTPEKILSEIKGKDKFFNAKQAVSFGLADEIITRKNSEVMKFSEPINVEGREIEYNDAGKPGFDVLCEGKFFHPVYGDIEITENVLNKMKENFDNNVRGIDISIDYTHENDNGEHPAACWIKGLDIVDGDNGKVLKATDVEFTPQGRKKVEEKEYKYISADFVIDYVSEKGKHIPYVLRGGTLTNRPFLKELNPIKLSENKQTKKEYIKMEKEAAMNALKEHGIDVLELQEKNQTLEAEKQELSNKINELNALPAEKDEEIKALKEKITELDTTIISNKKEEVFNALVEEGKVVPAQKEQVLNSFDKPETIEAFYKDAPVVVKKTPEGSGGEGTDDALSEEEQRVAASGECTKEEILAYRSTDKKKVTSK